MPNNQQDSTAQLEVERRTLGREHTGNLLKMLRGGYGSVVQTAALPVPSSVAETTANYARCHKLAPQFPAYSAPIASVAESLQQPDGKLTALMAGVAALEQARRVFNSYLRQDLRQHALLIRQDAEAWVVQTESEVWAIRLRYALFEIREVLSVHCGFPLPKPRIYIVPHAAPPPAPAPQRRLVPQIGDALEELAADESDAQLRAALRRLAGRV